MRRPSPYGEAITLERYWEIEPTLRRPLTDSPIGAHSYARRKNDARSSRLIAQHGPPPPSRRPKEAVA